MKPRTRLQYAERLEPVLLWMAAHPDADPDLHQLADMACLSPYHFHRVYCAMMGESVAATVQRMRMHRAAVALGAGTVPLRDVSVRAGYASPAAFNRAFGSIFGMSPGRYRIARSSPFNPQELGMYPVTIETFPGVILATMPHVGSYQEIGPVFDRLYMLASSRGLIAPDVPGYGIYYDDPDQIPKAQLRSRAGVPVASDAVLGDSLERFEIPAGRCAVLTYIGPYNEMEAAYHWMFSQWLPTSGVEPADFPMFEEYLNDPHTTPPAQLKTKIYLPLASQ